MQDNIRLSKVFDAIDKVNAADPNSTEIEGKVIANEVLYSQRMTQCLSDFHPDASEILQIAVRAQHIERWHLARSAFPEGRSGYKKWRSQLALHHADLTATLMADQGYSDEECQRVRYLLLKRGLKQDTESQCLEDVACLVFLNHYFADFALKHSEEKLINIIQLTWKKMSDKAHETALKLNFAPEHLALVQKALA